MIHARVTFITTSYFAHFLRERGCRQVQNGRKTKEAKAAGGTMRMQRGPKLGGAPGYIWELDEEGKLTYANRLPSGHEPDSMVGRGLGEIVPQAMEVALSDALDEVRRTRGESSVLSVVEDSDGTLVEWRAQVAALVEDEAISGFAIMCLTAMIDTTGKPSRHSYERRYWSLLANLPDVVSELDETGTLLYINRVEPGFDMDDILGMKAYDFVPDGQKDTFKEHLALALETSESQQYDSEVPTPDGETLFFENRIVPLDAPNRALLISSNITDRLRSERLHRASEDRYRALVENMPTHLTELTPDGVITYVNYAAGSLTSEEVVGKRHIDFLPEDQHQIAVDAIEAAVATGEVQSYEVTAKLPDGLFHFENKVAPIVADGEVQRVLVLSSDITERRRHQLDIEAANASLESANRELQSFAYSVSHDLRQPLRGLSGLSNALIEDYGHKLDEQGLDWLRRLDRAGIRMGQLIDDLLRLSRIHQVELVREDVDMSAMALEILDELERQHPERDVEVRVAPDLLVNADKAILEIALFNLLGNAWKFTSDEKNARIEVGRDDSGYFVRDNGAGFDMSFATNLFKPFQRLHKPGEFPGTGIGLATAHRVVRRHGGRIWADGAIQEGATFHFTLPPPETNA